MSGCKRICCPLLLLFLFSWPVVAQAAVPNPPPADDSDGPESLTTTDGVALGLAGISRSRMLEEVFEYGQQVARFAELSSRFLRQGVSVPLYQNEDSEGALFYRLKAHAPIGYSSSGSLGTVGLKGRVGAWQLYLEAQPKVDIRDLHAEVNASVAVKVRF